MILTAHQPVYLPWLGLFHKIALADLFISFDQVQYQPKDWNNRNLVKTPSGPVWLTVPVLRKGYLSKTISEIEINNKEPWARKHLKTISLSYSKSPYYREYISIFEDVYSKKWHTLVELNEAMLKIFLGLLSIDVPVRSAGEWQFRGSKSDLVLDMCMQVQASDYIFGEQGKNYADSSKFRSNGVRDHYQSYNHPKYPQLHGDFLENLSILDLLFNCGPESISILLSGNATRSDILRNT